MVKLWLTLSDGSYPMANIIIQASSRYPVHRGSIKAIVHTVLSQQNIIQEIEVEINIIGDRKMAQLNWKYMRHQGTTDILSFPLEEGFSYEKSNLGLKIDTFVNYPDNITRLGTIFISYPQTRRQANEHKLTVDEELNRLVEHGLLHLLGIHHE